MITIPQKAAGPYRQITAAENIFAATGDANGILFIQR